MLSPSRLLSDIANIEDNADNLRRLIDQLNTPIGVIPFVGAGLSIPFDFPGWGSFLTLEARKADIEAQIQGRLARGEYEEAAQDLLTARGSRSFRDAINNTFGVHKLKGKELKGAVSYLPQLAAGPVITTNFDHVLEEIFKQAKTPFEREVWGVNAELAMTAMSQNRKFLLKIHSDSEYTSDLILTKDDYLKYYGGIDGSSVDLSYPLPNLLRQMLSGRPLLFLGCSLNRDRIIGLLEEVMGSSPYIAHYAFVEQPASPEHFHERSRFLSNHNIRPVWYPDGRHDIIEPLLAYLTKITPEALEKDVARAEVERLQETVLRAEGDRLQETVKDKQSVTYVQTLVQSLLDPDLEESKAVVNMLGKIGGFHAVSAHIKIPRTQNEAKDLLIAAITDFGRLKNPGAVLFLRSILEDVRGKVFEDIKENSDIIVHAGKALREIGTQDAQNFLEEICPHIPDQEMVEYIFGERRRYRRFYLTGKPAPPRPRRY
jgi:SIR2-like domain